MNNSNSILLIDPAFDPTTALNCNLLIKIGTDSFSYAIINKQHNKVIAVYDEQECENVDVKFVQRIETDSYLKLTYNEVSIAIFTPNVITVPNSLYDEYSLKSHSKLFTGSHSELYTQVHLHFDFTTIFSISKNIKSILNQHFTSAKKLQENTGLITIAEQFSETSLLLDFSVNSFNALYIKNDQIAFQQCYEIAQTEEFNYYLLLMISQLNIDTKETTLFLSGIIHENDEKYNCLLKYFNKVDFLKLDSNLDQEVVNDMPLHYYSNLLALHKCVL